MAFLSCNNNSIREKANNCNKYNHNYIPINLEDALNYNQKVWTFFQAELSMQDNPLPDEIKKNLLALSMFVDRRTFEALAYPAPEKLDILININLNVSAGLRGDA